MNTIFDEQELTEYSKKTLIKLFLSQQELLKNQEVQLKSLNEKIDLLIEKLALAQQQRFGRSSEKVTLEVDLDQLSMFLNEAEAIKANLYIPEPDMEDVMAHKRKAKGKRDQDLSNLEVRIFEHYLDEEELNKQFPDGYKCLPDEIYKRLRYEPAKYLVEEHHVGVYAGKDNETMVKGKRPVDVFRNSIATPSLIASIINAKYVNHMPLYRQEQEFKRQEVHLARQVMANWMILVGERYFSLLHDHMHQELMKLNVIQADETTVSVSKDGRKAGSKSYMWVYRTGKLLKDPPIVLYEYQKTRKTDHPKEFLKGYKGMLISDGYQSYHKIAKEDENIKVAGCWSHARRPFAQLVKATGEKNAKGTVAYDILLQIRQIYKMDNSITEMDLTAEEIVNRRQLLVKPLVDAFFEWIKEHRADVMPKSKTTEGINYCINQESYLREFLSHGEVPLDNNATESTIRGFCIGRNNWKLIDTVNGAKSSAIIYSIVETAKANNLKPYEYFKYLLEEMPKHMSDKDTTFIEELLPWSDSLPSICRNKSK
jgi:transposase